MLDASAAVLVAVFSPQAEPGEVWRDAAAWRTVPPAVLQGVDGKNAASAEVRARWNEDWLFVEFVCEDDRIVSPGKEDGADHFRLGDVVEVFVGREEAPGYAEVHATPRGRKTAYFFSDYRREAGAPAGAEDVMVRAARVPGGWRAVISLPWTVLGAEPLAGGWQLLAGRYDYDREGGAPVLSSFPAQTGRPDFHKRGAFARLELRP